MDVSQIKDTLSKMIAILHGGRDRTGSPVIVLPSYGECVDFPQNEVMLVLSYLSRVPDEVDIQHGFCIIIDMRNAWIRHLRTVLRAIQQVLVSKVKHVVIVKPTNFLAQQRIGIELRLETLDFKTNLVSIEKLGRYVDSPYLPRFLGGTFPYVHSKWLELRLRYESFLREGSSVLKDLELQAFNGGSDSNFRRSMMIPQSSSLACTEDAEQRLTSCLIKGDLLLSDLRAEELSDASPFLKVPNPDIRSAARRVDVLVKEINSRKIRLHECTAQQTRERGECVLYDQFSMGVKNLTDWLLGAGEKWLSSLNEVAESHDEAEQLRREYEQLPTKSQEVLEQANDLLAIADQLLEMDHSAADIAKKREFLDSVSKAFAMRVKRQCELVLACSSFYGLVDEFGKSLDEMLEDLCSPIEADDVSTTEAAIQQLDIRIENIDKAFSDVMGQGHQFIDQLTRATAVAVSSVTPSYAAGAAQVRRVLDEVGIRKERCNELSDVRRLKLQQLYQLFTCEKDAEQARYWLEDLVETVASQQLHIGVSADELAKLKKDLFKLESTAKSTYDYGKQLVQASLVLRRSLRYELQPNAELSHHLEETWKHFVRTLSERSARLTVSNSFVNTLHQVNAKLEELCSVASAELCDETGSERYQTGSSNKSAFSVRPDPRRCEMLRAQTSADIKDLRNLADALVKKIERPLTSKMAATGGTVTECSDADKETIREIRNRLAQAEERQRLLDNYWTTKLPVTALVRDVSLNDHPYLHAPPASPLVATGN